MGTCQKCEKVRDMVIARWNELQRNRKREPRFESLRVESLIVIAKRDAKIAELRPLWELFKDD